MNKEVVFNCGHLARFTPRSEWAYMENDKRVTIERPCKNCRGRNKVAVKAGRIARWLERRRIRKEEELVRLARRPVIKQAEITINRKMRRQANAR